MKYTTYIYNTFTYTLGALVLAVLSASLFGVHTARAADNAAPRFIEPLGSATVAEGSLFARNVAALVSDPDGDTLAFSLVSGAPAGATLGAKNGLLTWTPSEVQGPGTYTLTIAVFDGQHAAVDDLSVAVTEVNTAPSTHYAVYTTRYETPVLTTMYASDPDLPTQKLSFSIVHAPEHGTLSTVAGDKVIYSPEAGFSGVDSFKYTVSDGEATSAPDVVAILVRVRGEGVTASVTPKDIQEEATGASTAQPSAAPAQTETAKGALTIRDAHTEDVDAAAGTAHVVWQTNVPSQSMVVCGLPSNAPYTFEVTAPNFGYQWSTALMRARVTEHRVPLASLAAGSHYCRVASRENDSAPWTVSNEFIFVVGAEGGTASTGAGATSLLNTTESTTAGGEVTAGEETSLATGTGEGTEASGHTATGLFSLGHLFSWGTCAPEWDVWVLVALALLFATTWPREALVAKTADAKSLTRFYWLSAIGTVTFLIVFVQGQSAWVVPIGLGTMVLIAGTVANILYRETVAPRDCLRLVTLAILTALLLAAILAILFGWTCAIVPLVLLVVIIAVRYLLARKKDTNQ